MKRCDQALEELEVAGNQLTALPEVGALTALVKLAAYGNVLESLPASIGSLASLQHLWLQGNRLSTLPPSVCRLEVRGCGRAQAAAAACAAKPAGTCQLLNHVRLRTCHGQELRPINAACVDTVHLQVTASEMRETVPAQACACC